MVNMMDDVIYLLGAGASFDAGLPLASELTARLIDRVNNDSSDTFGRKFASTVRALNFIVASMLAHDGRRGANPTVLPDIERLVSAVKLLGERDDLEVAPFITSWDATVDALDVKAAQVPTMFGRNFAGAVLRRGRDRLDPDHQKIESLIKSVIDAFMRPPRKEVFHELYGELVRKLLIELRIESSSVLYLEPLVATRPAAIATLNYDLTVETACSVAGVPVSTGVDGWGATGELAWTSDAIPLMKLHGSADWSLSSGGVFETSVALERNRSAALVFGRREKLRPEGPFLQLLEAFRAALWDHRTLVVVGYSFADEHINMIIRRWLDTEQSRRLMLVDPGFNPAPTFPLSAGIVFYKEYSERRQPPQLAVRNETARDFAARLQHKMANSVVDMTFADLAGAAGSAAL